MRRNDGFSLIEMLVSLVLLGVLLLVVSGLVLPLNLTRTASNQTSAAAVSQSYLELLKSRWLNDATFTAMTLPLVCLKGSTTTGCDITIDSAWTLEIRPAIKSAWAATDLLRSVIVDVTMTDGKKVSFSTLVAKP
jgi:prepilin-type N-terminal cleavage/methylation domain-containing protein